MTNCLSKILPRLRAMPVMVRVQLCATVLNSASVVVKLFMPLLFRHAYSFDFDTIGLLMALYGGGCVLGAYMGGALTERVDARIMTATSLSVSGALAWSIAQSPTIGWLYLVVLAIGIADGAFRPANLRLIMESSGADDGIWLQGLHRICFNFGVALAGAMAGSLADHGYPSLFAAAGAANLLGGLLVIYSTRLPTTATLHRQNIDPVQSSAGHSPWVDRMFLLFILGQLLALGIFDQMYGTLGLFLAEDYRLSSAWLGYLFSLNAVLVVGLQAPAMAWITRVGLVAACRWGTICLVLAFPLLNMGRGITYAITAMICLTAAEILLTPAWTLAVMNRSQGRNRGRYLGLFSAA